MGARRPSVVPGPQSARRAKARGRRAREAPTERRRGLRRLANTTALRRFPPPPTPTSTTPAPLPSPGPGRWEGLLPSRRGSHSRAEACKKGAVTPPHPHTRWAAGPAARGMEGPGAAATGGWPARPEAGAREEDTCENLGMGSGRQAAGQPHPNAPRPQAVAHHSLHRGTTHSRDLPPTGSDARAGQSAHRAAAGGRGLPEVARAATPVPARALQLPRAGCGTPEPTWACGPSGPGPGRTPPPSQISSGLLI